MERTLEVDVDLPTIGPAADAARREHRLADVEEQLAAAELLAARQAPTAWQRSAHLQAAEAHTASALSHDRSAERHEREAAARSRH